MTKNKCKKDTISETDSQTKTLIFTQFYAIIQRFLDKKIFMRFKVPQDVQREDQILWILTLRQVITLIVGFGFSYVLFSSLRKQYDLHQMEIIMIWIPAGLSAAFAFLKVKGISLGKFVLLLIEQNLFRAPRRKWVQHGGEPFISLTTPFSMKNKKKTETQAADKDVSEKKIKNIAAILDSSGTSGLSEKKKAKK